MNILKTIAHKIGAKLICYGYVGDDEIKTTLHYLKHRVQELEQDNRNLEHKLTMQRMKTFVSVLINK